MRATRRSLLLACLVVQGCVSSFPERQADVDHAGRLAMCPDFRTLDAETPLDVFDRTKRFQPSGESTPLGCSTARSLRVMVADPDDLLGGQTRGARGPTPAMAVDRYTSDARKDLPALSTLEVGGDE